MSGTISTERRSCYYACLLRSAYVCEVVILLFSWHFVLCYALLCCFTFCTVCLNVTECNQSPATHRCFINQCIIFLTPVLSSQGMKKYAKQRQKSTKIKFIIIIIIIIIIIRPHRSHSVAAYSRQTFPWTICRSVRLSVQCIVEKRRIGS